MRIATLNKKCGPDAVKALISFALKEVFNLTLSPITPQQLVQMAGELQSTHYALNFEEIICALKKGINGEFGIIYGHINYQHIAGWMSKYMEEREKRIMDYRDKQHEEVNSKNFALTALAAIPTEEIERIGRHAESQPIAARNIVPSVDVQRKLNDGAKLVFLEKHGDKMKIERLLEWKREADANGWERTLVAVEAKVNLRFPLGVWPLAKKIAAGQQAFTDCELQIQANFPAELETALKFFAPSEVEIKPETERPETNDKYYDRQFFAELTAGDNIHRLSDKMLNNAIRSAEENHLTESLKILLAEKENRLERKIKAQSNHERKTSPQETPKGNPEETQSGAGEK